MMNIINKLFNLHKEQKSLDSNKNDQESISKEEIYDYDSNEYDFWKKSEDVGIDIQRVFIYYDKKGHNKNNTVTVPIPINSIIFSQYKDNIIRKYSFNEPIKVSITKTYATISESQERKSRYSLFFEINHSSFKEQIVITEATNSLNAITLSLYNVNDDKNRLLIRSKIKQIVIC